MASLLSRVRPCTKQISFSNQCRMTYCDSMSDRERIAAYTEADAGRVARTAVATWWNEIRDVCEGQSMSYDPSPRDL